ncbi:MAG: tetratricopeptide repeat protein [Desulfobacteraceae bacterium]|nr:tetratricopeptide repeat protein [Desulfobacteraceae bacterium]
MKGKIPVRGSKKQSGGRISLCMITRDEEHFLAQCFNSVKPLVDEIIVVDTGSTDRTVDIAGSYGAKIYHHVWEDDYSKHRNQSISYATGEWILIMDADEVIASRDVGRVRAILNSVHAEGFLFTLRNYENKFDLANLQINPNDYEEGKGYPGFIPQDLIRLFKNDPDIYFTGKVHETVTKLFQESGKLVCNTGIPIHHYGKVRKDRLYQKQQIYLRLGEDKVRENPDEPMAYKYLADQYLELGMPDSALEVTDKGLALFPDMIELHFNRGLALSRMQQLREAKIEYQWVLDRKPEHLGACHNLAQIYFSEDQFKEVVELLTKGIDLGLCHPAVYFLLGRVYDAAGNWEKSLEQFDRALEIQPNCPDVNCYKAVIFLNRNMYDTALNALEKEIEISGNLAGAYTLLGQMSHELKDLKSAVQFFQKVLTIKPDDPTAKNYLRQNAGQ